MTSPFATYYFQGVCGHCDREITHRRGMRRRNDTTHEWVSCDGCGGITRLPKDGSKVRP